MSSSPPPDLPAQELSAGGVVVDAGKVVVIVPRKRSPDGHAVLGLPKGHLDPGETAEQAAAREVREEAGVEAELIDALGQVRYWKPRREGRVAKQVTFFLFEYRSGDPSDHDDEVERAFWLPLAEAITALTYAGEREMVARALSRLSSDR
jgi:8-oxo-dGTP pyrophosphatase MutT (NUDIX family)